MWFLQVQEEEEVYAGVLGRAKQKSGVVGKVEVVQNS